MVEVYLDNALQIFWSAWNSVYTFLHTYNFHIGVINFDLWTLTISIIALELIWWFVRVNLLSGVWDDD